MILTFGKYRGWQIDELPFSYLAWLWETDFIKDELREAVRKEILCRVNDSEEMGGEVVADKKHLQRIYRTLALTYHPDITGGNGDIMTGINLIYEALQ